MPATMQVAMSRRGRLHAVEDAFDDAFAEHSTRLYRLALLLTGDQERAEDVVAEAFAAVWPRWRAGKVDDLPSYLRRAVVNQSNGRFRRLRLERREEAKHRGDDRGPVAVDAATADRDEVLGVLRQLPEGQRAAIVLRYYEDRPEAEVAELLGVAVGTVKSQVSRGLDRMRTLLQAGRTE